ncbi:MAG: GAF domain-containing protein [Planctomycetes bacterium]|nr:GAF domain-containing protein [Planctomycetota bacterium]
MLNKKIANILVVDEEARTRQMLIDALSSLPARVQATASAAEALAIVRDNRPDLLVTKQMSSRLDSVDIVERLQALAGRIPAVVLTESARPIADGKNEPTDGVVQELVFSPMPTDLDRLRNAVQNKLAGMNESDRLERRVLLLKNRLGNMRIQRKKARHEASHLQATLKTACRAFSNQMSLLQEVIRYQGELFKTAGDDDVFLLLFRTFLRWTGSVCGIALVCDGQARLKMVGRFGSPKPDPLAFCQKLVRPIIDQVIRRPQCAIIDAGEHANLFDKDLKPFLPGLTLMTIPLLPEADQLVGMIILYRKGEQPFTEDDIGLAEAIAPLTAVIVHRNV